MKFKKIIAGMITAGILAGCVLAPMGGSAVINASAEVFEDYTYFETDVTSGSTNNDLIITKYSGNKEEITIPSYINNRKVVRIGIACFKDNKMLKKVVIPEGIKRIDESAFEGCINLKSATLPQSLNLIGRNAFAGCIHLDKIVLPRNIAEIQSNAFSGSGLTSIDLPRSVATMGLSVFANCKNLKSVNLAYGTKKLGERTFFGCESLASITLPDTIRQIDALAFGNCTSLTSLTVPEGIKNINYLDGNTSLTSLYLPNSIIPDKFFGQINEGCTIYAEKGSSAELLADLYGYEFKGSKTKDKLPDAPKNVKVSGKTVSWDPVKGADGYIVFEYTNKKVYNPSEGNANLCSYNGKKGKSYIVVSYKYIKDRSGSIVRRAYSAPSKSVKVKK